ncbi:hypothetical protein FBU30_007368 [Linnemannia zychae]|nr:hypothetical protein FBU30_007368 [Linnemannia zychae]
MEINPAITFKHDRSVMHAKRPKVLIVGAGIAGLTLGMLLNKTDIPFEIYERAPEVKPLGSAMYFNAATANIFRQCGIYEEFVSMGKQVFSMQLCNENREVNFSMSFEGQDKDFGANGYIVSRPKVYDLILRQIPKERIHFGMKVLSMDQGGNGVVLRFSNGTEAEGDILVGADGAYSAVRQSLYTQLKKKKQLPASDALPLPFSTVCVVGQTRPLTAEEFPDIAQEQCQYRKVTSSVSNYSWSTFTTAQDTVCWSSILYLNEATSKEHDSFRNSEWGPEAAAAMCEEIKDFPIVSGGDQKLTLEYLIERTPKNLISKVMLEEKVFKTWSSGRTVLIGDACHKFSPSGGVGATNAVHDAIVLANRINGLPFHPIIEEIEAAFNEYKTERIDWVMTGFNSSRFLRTMSGQNLSAKVLQQIVKYLPASFKRKGEFGHRPQAAFLPLFNDTGRYPATYQPSLHVKAPQEEEEVAAPMSDQQQASTVI